MIYKLLPVLKSYIWGGEELQRIFDFDQDRLAEAWILSCNRQGSSRIEGTNKNLFDLFLENRDIVAENAKGNFPLLVKLLCSSRTLSIQNHPVGKAEFWYILDCKEDSYIYWGLNRDLTKEELADAIKNSTILNYLNKVKVQKGDCFLVPPGMVHMIGKGILALEIQQNLNVTYRLFDFGRRDQNGNLRELKIKEGVEIADLKKHEVKYRNVLGNGEIVANQYFTAHLYNAQTTLNADKKFNFIYIVSGNGKIDDKDAKTGDCFFVEAGHGKYTLSDGLEFVVIQK